MKIIAALVALLLVAEPAAACRRHAAVRHCQTAPTAPVARHAPAYAYWHDEPATGARCPVHHGPGFFSRNAHWLIPAAAIGVGVLVGVAITDRATSVVVTNVIGACAGSGRHAPRPPCRH